jgi:hypothetical protein
MDSVNPTTFNFPKQRPGFSYAYDLIFILWVQCFDVTVVDRFVNIGWIVDLLFYNIHNVVYEAFLGYNISNKFIVNIW